MSSFKRKVLLASLERVRKQESALVDQLKPVNFKKAYPSWKYNEQDRQKKRSQLEAKLAEKREVLAELRLYLNPGE